MLLIIREFKKSLRWRNTVTDWGKLFHYAVFYNFFSSTQSISMNCFQKILYFIAQMNQYY